MKRVAVLLCLSLAMCGCVPRKSDSQIIRELVSDYTNEQVLEALGYDGYDLVEIGSDGLEFQEVLKAAGYTEADAVEYYTSQHSFRTLINQVDPDLVYTEELVKDVMLDDPDMLKRLDPHGDAVFYYVGKHFDFEVCLYALGISEEKADKLLDYYYSLD